MSDPPILVSKADPVYVSTQYTKAMHQRCSCAVDMDYPRSLVEAVAEYQSRRDFFSCKYLAAMAYS